MTMFTPLNIVLIGVVALLGVGLYGLLITRNLIKLVIVLQILVKAVVLALVMAGKVSGSLGLGQSTAATVIVADTIVAVVGLALAVQVRRRVGTLDVSQITTLKG
jgi:NADH-quinone oxidoreductase subunit K